MKKTMLGVALMFFAVSANAGTLMDLRCTSPDSTGVSRVILDFGISVADFAIELPHGSEKYVRGMAYFSTSVRQGEFHFNWQEGRAVVGIVVTGTSSAVVEAHTPESAALLRCDYEVRKYGNEGGRRRCPHGVCG